MTAAAPLLVIGLGNPGGDYEGTRHNVGAEALGILAQRLQVKLRSYRGPAWLARQIVAERELILARPKTFMNESGVAGSRLTREFNVPLAAVVVIYDELDLKLGRLRIRARGGTAGHNGLRSLQAHWRSQEFPRVRIGIGRPPAGQDPVEYVLGRPAGQEKEVLERACRRAADAVLAIASVGLEQAMTEYNRVDPEDVADAE
ncbi:MAG TPA: aminoacyl-tRNA hydrolase [Candidatus Dormibacteraeota bacterium]|nr:aminoacyl-tRNA hydrolase [Candidatus Dormibacteraeota bacterium]